VLNYADKFITGKAATVPISMPVMLLDYVARAMIDENRLVLQSLGCWAKAPGQ
jgi:hypothetical protein